MVFVLFFLQEGMATACESSQARDQTHTAAVTQAAAVTMPDPYLNLLCHKRTPQDMHS